MAVSVTHPYVSAQADSGDTSLVQPSDWNAAHSISGLGDAAEKNVGTTAGTVAAGDHTHSGVYQPADAGLTDIAGLAVTDGNVIVGDGANWVAESGATARASLGLTIGTHVQAYDADTAKIDVAQTWTAAQSFASSDVKITGSSTGKTSIASANSSGTDYVFTIPAVTATAATLGANVYTGQQTFVEMKETVYTISDGVGFEIDPANGSIQLITLGANRTPAATNFEAGQSVTLMIADGTAYTITWTTVAVTWVGGSAPTLATSGYTVVVLWKVGTTIYGLYAGSVA